jgi:hypothetical protein
VGHSRRFGLDEIEQGNARANDVTAVRDKTRDEHDAAKPISLIESQMLQEYHAGRSWPGWV